MKKAEGQWSEWEKLHWYIRYLEKLHFEELERGEEAWVRFMVPRKTEVKFEASFRSLNGAPKGRLAVEEQWEKRAMPAQDLEMLGELTCKIRAKDEQIEVLKMAVRMMLEKIEAAPMFDMDGDIVNSVRGLFKDNGIGV